MGILTGTNIISRARRVLQDTTSGGTRWLDAELLDWINDAQREVVLLKPNANSTTADAVMIQGTKQSLPTGGLQLLSVVRNTAGNAIRRVDRSIMDSENPAWHVDTESNISLHYMFDEDDPETFYLYPAQTASPGSIELIYSTAPTDLAAVGDTIDLNDIYANVILDYILYRAYSKDSDYAGNAQRASNHYQAFNNSLGNRVNLEGIVSPNADNSRKQG